MDKDEFEMTKDEVVNVDNNIDNNNIEEKKDEVQT